MEYKEIKTLDDLQNALVERKEERLRGFIKDVALAAFAYDAHAEAVVAEYAGWSAATVKRMAMLNDLPLPLLDPELPLGVYWVAIKHTDSPAEAHALIRCAIDGRWSVADAKEALGLMSERTAAPRFKGSLARSDDGELIVTPDEPPDYVPARVEVREVAT